MQHIEFGDAGDIGHLVSHVYAHGRGIEIHEIPHADREMIERVISRFGSTIQNQQATIVTKMRMELAKKLPIGALNYINSVEEAAFWSYEEEFGFTRITARLNLLMDEDSKTSMTMGQLLDIIFDKSNSDDSFYIGVNGSARLFGFSHELNFNHKVTGSAIRGLLQDTKTTWEQLLSGIFDFFPLLNVPGIDDIKGAFIDQISTHMDKLIKGLSIGSTSNINIEVKNMSIRFTRPDKEALTAYDLVGALMRKEIVHVIIEYNAKKVKFSLPLNEPWENYYSNKILKTICDNANELVKA